MSEPPIVPREIRTVFEGRVFTVQVETITLPKGGRAARRRSSGTRARS